MTHNTILSIQRLPLILIYSLILRGVLHTSANADCVRLHVNHQTDSHSKYFKVYVGMRDSCLDSYWSSKPKKQKCSSLIKEVQSSES
ncbi:hypothetical protein BKA66DRAFT_467070 [Pyrenochaeta sp. MPI-SDFR-AT-0127]|nr:hypothetical protein BKA66DRAFT_467070 [Pyrenochaeta sp. MPI-SDFR-AT-0127]